MKAKIGITVIPRSFIPVSFRPPRVGVLDVLLSISNPLHADGFICEIESDDLL